MSFNLFRILFLHSLFLIFSYTSIFSQVLPGAKQIALANSDIASSTDIFSFHSNPASMSLYNWREIGVFYSPQPFGMTELMNFSTLFSEYTPYGSFAAGFSNYGFELYKESKIIFGYSNDYKKKIMVGFSFIYNMVNIKNYGSESKMTINASLLYLLENNMRLGFSVHNLFNAYWGESDSQLPSLFLMGLSYDLAPSASIHVSIEKERDYPASVNFGINYELIEYFAIRGGASSLPKKISFGIGINYECFQFDYALFTHTELGETHQLNLVYSFLPLTKEGGRSKLMRDYLQN